MRGSYKNNVQAARRAARTFVEVLEGRLLLNAIHIDLQFPPQYDPSGFFASQARRDLLQAAADDLTSGLDDTLAAIPAPPSGSNDTWSESFKDPATGTQTSIAEPSVPADHLTIYVGSRQLSTGTGTTPGAESSTGYSVSGGDPSWNALIKGRGKAGATGSNPTQVARWGGAISFDNNPGVNWYFGTDPTATGPGQYSAFTVAQRGIGFILGIGELGGPWQNLISNSAFTGAHAETVYGGPVPVRGNNWADNLQSFTGGPATMTQHLNPGPHPRFSPLDYAGLADIGWGLRLSNDPPTASAGGPYRITQGTSLLLDASASSDPDGDSLTYAWDINSDGNFTDATGVKPALTWSQLQALGLSTPGVYNLSVRVNDGHGHVVTSAATQLTIQPNSPPVLTAIANRSVNEGSTLSFTASASDADMPGEILTYTLDPGAPAGASIDPATGLFSFTPDDGPAIYNVTVRVTDNGTPNLSDTQTFTITVNNLAPTASFANSGSVNEGAAVSVSFFNFLDTSAADTAAGFHYSIALDPSLLANDYASATDPASKSFITTQSGTLTVYGRIFDKDNGFTPYTSTITVRPVSISGFIYNDLDADGQKDAADAPLANWMVFIDTNVDGQREVGEPYSFTSASGFYSFTNLAPGAYRVVCLPINLLWKASAGTSPDVTVGSGDGAIGQNLGFYQPISISGNLYSDSNGNGKKDTGELNLVGWRVYLDADKDGAFDNGETSLLTDPSGNYNIAGLLPGSYRLAYVLPAGWKATSPASTYIDVTLSSAGKATQNFAIQPPASVSGCIFNDLSGEGVRNTGELALASRLVFLDTNKNGKLDAGEKSLLTDSAGRYTFSGLVPGSYRVAAVPPTGWRISAPTAGYYDVALSGGQVLTARDFGQTQKILITGSVWNDANSNGIRNTADSGLYNYRVYIDLDKDGMWDASEPSVLTDRLGNFSFSTLAAGTYTIRVAQPKGYRVTYPKVGYYSSALKAGQALVLSFGVGK